MTWISCVGMYSSTNGRPCRRCHSAVLPVFLSPRITIFTGGAKSKRKGKSNEPNPSCTFKSNYKESRFCGHLFYLSCQSQTQETGRQGRKTMGGNHGDLSHQEDTWRHTEHRWRPGPMGQLGVLLCCWRPQPGSGFLLGEHGSALEPTPGTPGDPQGQGPPPAELATAPQASADCS